jgi:DNA-directed primase/polymerase protein
LDEFIVELGVEFQRLYDLTVDRSCIVDLDSSTDAKFSRHLIVHLPNQALFEDAAAAGRFVRVFVGRLAELSATGQLFESRPVLAKNLFVKSATPTTKQSSQQDSQLSSQSDKETELPWTKTCFVDMGVYTRNRLFRLLGSSKFGKPASAALRIAPSNVFPFPHGFDNDSFYVPAMEKHVKEAHSGDDEELDMVRRQVSL